MKCRSVYQWWRMEPCVAHVDDYFKVNCVWLDGKISGCHHGLKNYDDCPEVDTDISIRKQVRLKKLLSTGFPVHAANTNENTNIDTFNQEIIVSQGTTWRGLAAQYNWSHLQELQRASDVFAHAISFKCIPRSHLLLTSFLVFRKRASYPCKSLSFFWESCLWKSFVFCESLSIACIISSWKSHSDFPGLCSTVCAQEPLCLPLFPNSVTTSLTPLYPWACTTALLNPFGCCMVGTLNTLRLQDCIEYYRVIFFTGPAQKSSKYGTGPAQ